MSAAETLAATSHDTSICPWCDGRPERETVETIAGDITHLVVNCEICERTGRVSRELARAMWRGMPGAC